MTTPARRVVLCLKILGHAKIIKKTDGENSIIVLADAVKAFRNNDIAPENVPDGEHESNGVVDRCVRTVVCIFGVS